MLRKEKAIKAKISALLNPGDFGCVLTGTGMKDNEGILWPRIGFQLTFILHNELVKNRAQLLWVHF